MVKAKEQVADIDGTTAFLRHFGGWFAIILAGVFLLSASDLSAQRITVGLMDEKKVSGLLLSPSSGNYALLNEQLDTLYRFRSDDALSVSILEGKLLVKTPYGFSDTLNKLTLAGNGTSPGFRLRFNEEKQDRNYPDDLIVQLSDDGLRVVNSVGVERYVGRVVQAEVGYGANDEYYKIQSIICRTYATRNLERHATQGFDLCDNEHCQVFSGWKKTSDEVVKATSATSGLIMVGPDNQPILSAFHANCGGQTANSEDVWRESRPYLVAVNDTFCTASRSASWEKSMPLNEFLTQVGFDADNEGLNGSEFLQSDRNKYFKLGTDSIETAQMRRLLQLRSTYFDLKIADGKVDFVGRGYGHGVGLCQQGAMKMAESGYTFGQILGYYYKGVSLIPITSLQPK